MILVLKTSASSVDRDVKLIESNPKSAKFTFNVIFSIGIIIMSPTAFLIFSVTYVSISSLMLGFFIEAVSDFFTGTTAFFAGLLSTLIAAFEERTL